MPTADTSIRRTMLNTMYFQLSLGVGRNLDFHWEDTVQICVHQTVAGIQVEVQQQCFKILSRP